MLNSIRNFLRKLGGGEQASNEVDPTNYGDNTSNYNSGAYPAGGGEKWPFGLSASGASAYINHWTARQNARVAVQDSVQARAVVERFADTVADIGLRLEMMPQVEILGITREEGEKWARDVEIRFDLWARDKKQHRAETMNFYQSHWLYQLGQHRDGENFMRLYYTKGEDLQNPLQFSFVDPDQLRGDAFTSTINLPGRFDGIKRDERGREIAYKIWNRSGDGKYKYVEIPAKKGGRIFMLHGYRPEYAGQGRGYSRLTHALQELEKLTDYTVATIAKAISQSNIAAFIEPSKDEDAANPFEGMLTDKGAGPASVFGSDPTNTEGCSNVTEESLRKVECYEVPEATINVPGSMIITNLQKGSSVKFPANTAPGDSFDTFANSFFSFLSASTGAPIEVVLMKFGQNYSASRATLLLFWRICIMWRMEMASDYLDPTVEMWLSEEIAAGRIIAPGWSDPRLRAAWLNSNWIGTPPPDIDPSKTAKARRDNVEIGVTNLEREARNYNGSSAASNIEKNRELFEDFPIIPWLNQQMGGDQESSDDSDDKEEND